MCVNVYTCLRRAAVDPVGVGVWGEAAPRVFMR